MRKTLAVHSLIISAIACAASAHAYEYEFRHYVTGLQHSTTPAEPAEPQDEWTLPGATLPDAVTGESYSFSFYDLVTPSGLDGFQWSGQSIPRWAEMDAVTGVLTGTPSEDDLGEKSFAITATRSGLDGSQVYTIQVGGQSIQVTQIASGRAHTCAVTNAGAVVCWGANDLGQIGQIGAPSSSTPVYLQSLGSGIASITAGSNHSCAVSTTGTAYCWGANSSGQGGSGQASSSLAPTAITTLPNSVAKIEAGASHTCAITTGGALYCWGSNSQGELGNGTKSNSSSPQAVVGGLSSGVATVSAGKQFTCATTTSGNALCWGAGAQGQLGSKSYRNGSTVPVNMSSLPAGIGEIAAGANHVCARTSAGAAYCWASNLLAQGGNGGISSGTYGPVPVQGLGSGVQSLTTSNNHTCASKSDGSVVCWGPASEGQLGYGSTEGVYSPVPVLGLDGPALSVSAGEAHTCATTTTGKAFCWGGNDEGQLGLGGNNPAISAIEVSIPGS